MTTKNNINLDYFIDSAFTKYCWLYNNNSIFNCFKKSGFKIISKKSCYKKINILIILINGVRLFLV